MQAHTPTPTHTHRRMHSLSHTHTNTHIKIHKYTHTHTQNTTTTIDTHRTVGVITGIVDDNPFVRAFVVVCRDVADVRPEASIPLGGGPDALYDIVVDERVIGQPLYNLSTLECC